MQILLNATNKESAKTEIIDIIETLKHTQQKIKDGKTVDNLTEDMIDDIRKLDFTALQLQLLSTTDNHIVLDLK